MSQLEKKIMKTRNTTMKLIATVIAVAIATIWTIGGASTGGGCHRDH